MVNKKTALTLCIFAILIILIGTIFLVNGAINGNLGNNSNNTVSGKGVILYQFYGQGCPHCASQDNFLDDMEQKYSSLKVERYEIYLNEENRQLFSEMTEAFNTEIKGVPTIFIDKKVIMGYSSSLGRQIEEEIQRCLEEGCIDPIDRINGETTQIIGDSSPAENPESNETSEFPINTETEELTLAKVVSLAVVDAINPCALAVLALMLIAILTYNPKNRLNVLFAGLAFSLSVFIMYFIYGLIIIKFFQIIQALSSVRFYLYKCLAVAAIIIGGLNIRDYISYKPGALGTEMPLMMRPKVKKIISKVTSPSGAFIVGLFVTVFLLPCTIGPYIIAGGILSAMKIIKTIPPLLLYNAIFVIPMIFITGMVYLGIKKVDDVSEWKDRNIRKLHLFAGIIMIGLGIAMLIGWV